MFKKFLADESGATAIEYVIVASLIAVALVGGATALGNSVDDKLNDVATSVATAEDHVGDRGNLLGRD
jgi:pilus assembly protein Flp/PilA